MQRRVCAAENDPASDQFQHEPMVAAPPILVTRAAAEKPAASEDFSADDDTLDEDVPF